MLDNARVDMVKSDSKPLPNLKPDNKHENIHIIMLMI